MKLILKSIVVLLLCCCLLTGCDIIDPGVDYSSYLYSTQIYVTDGELFAEFDGDVTLSFGKLEEILYQFEELDDGTYAVRLDATIVAEGLTVEQDELKYSLDVEQTRELITEINFPATHNGKPVTVINGEYNPVSAGGSGTSFTNVTKVTFPQTVTTLGDNAFSYYTLLQEIALHEGITYIGHHALSNCESLTSITLPSTLTYLGDGAVSGCTSITSLTIPDSVEYLGEWIVSGCTSLAHLKMRLPEDSLNGTYHWLSSFAGGIEADLTLELTGGNILYGAMLSDCEALTKLIIHQMNVLEEQAIYSCPNLTEVEIGEDVGVLQNSAVYGSPNLKKITFHSTPGLGHDAINPYATYHPDFKIYFDGTMDELADWIELGSSYEWYSFTVVCSDGTVVVADYYN